jgi:Tfp pilus assembly PilM family ATPase
MANYLGIEIAPDVVRGVLVKTALRKVQIARFLEVPILAPAVPELVAPPFEGEGTPAPLAPDPTQVALHELVARMGSPRPSIFLSVPGEEVSMRRIELPLAVSKKLDELLPIEMEALVPFDAEETLLDHQPIETAEGKLHILVAAIPKARVQKHLTQFDAWGIDPDELAVGAAALDGLVNVMPSLMTGGPHLIVHFGSRRTDACVLARGHVELARTISAGIADVGDAGFASSGGFGSEYAGSAAERLARELRQTLAASRMQGIEPAAIHVSGFGAHDARVLRWVSEITGHEAQMLAVPDAMIPGQRGALVPSGLEPEVRASYGLALALAARALGKARRIDLRKGEFAPRRSSGFLREHTALVASCAAAIATAFFFSTYAQWSVLESRRTMLEEQLAEVTRERLGEETRSPSRARTLLEGGGTRSDPLPRFTAYDAIAEISSAIPEGITHDVQRLHVDLGEDRSGGHFELAGIVSSIEDRDRIAQALGSVECFRELELGPLTQAPNDRRLYRVEADIRCPGDEAPEDAQGRRGRSRSRSGSSGGGR